MLFLCLAALLLPVGCKKSNVEMDILELTVMPEVIDSGGDSEVLLRIINPSHPEYQVTFTYTSGRLSGGSVHSVTDESLRLIYYPARNTTDDKRRDLIEATATAGDVTISATAIIIVNPEGDS